MPDGKTTSTEYSKDACDERHKALWRVVGIWTLLFVLFGGTVVGIAMMANSKADAAAAKAAVLAAANDGYQRAMAESASDARKALEQRFSALDAKMEKVDGKLEKIGERLDKLADKFPK
jgi:predicted xylose isomerase-like sugar epimerase